MAKERLIPDRWDVPDVFRRRLGDEAGRQRAMVADGHVLLVLHEAPRGGQERREGRFFWRNPEGEWRSTHGGGGLGGLRAHVDEHARRVRELDDREHEAQGSRAYFEVLQDLAPLHRGTRHMRAALQQARELCPDVRELILLRDEAEVVERNAELLYHDAKNALDFAVAKQAEEQARTSHDMARSAHRLNLLAAFFFPVATLSAVFGVNLRHGLEQVDPPLPFAVFLAVGLGSGWLLKSLVTRRDA